MCLVCGACSASRTLEEGTEVVDKVVPRVKSKTLCPCRITMSNMLQWMKGFRVNKCALAVEDLSICV